MKSMLYVGATLMIGASIYGFVDYRQTHRKKEFQEMYAEKKKTEKPVVAEEKTVVPAVADNPVVIPEKKSPAKKVKSNQAKEENLPVISAVPEDEQPLSSINELGKDNTTKPEPARETRVVKKKKVRREFFSRGRMPEEEVVIDPVKKESGKKANKD